MAADQPDFDVDPQDAAEAFDETHLDEDAAEFSTLEELPDVFDATQALGDSRDVLEQDAADFDAEGLDDEDLETDEDVDDMLADNLEQVSETDDIDAEDLDAEDGVDRVQWDEAELQAVSDVDEVTDPDDEEADEYEAGGELSDEDLVELGYKDDPDGPPV